MFRLYIAVLTLVGCAFAPDAVAEDNKKAASFDDALQFLQRPDGNIDRIMSRPPGLQVHHRLTGVLYDLNYKNDLRDATQWLKIVNDPKENMYVRICAAYFLTETKEEARKFLESHLTSENLRYRYNAAEAVRMFVDRDPEKAWGIDLLLKHVASGSLDGSGVTSSPEGEFPDGDRDDIMRAPLDDFCWDLGFMKCQRAVPTLIGVLERLPTTGGAAFALGEIGDTKAIPALMKVLKNRSGYEHREVAALGKLKAKEAVPILITRLGNPETTTGGLDNLEMEDVLESLLAIGDRRAIEPIKAYIETKPSKSITAAAKRVLVQLDSEDAATELLALLEKETYEPERSDLMFALVRYSEDPRVLQRLSTMARKSDSAFMRREAIQAMGQMGTGESLLTLADLLGADFPNDIKVEWGWKIPPQDFTKYFRDQAHRILMDKTGKNFPAERTLWIDFLQASRIPSNEEQGGTGQPATRPESKSDGEDKPQPEAEGRTR
jgi:HEAT repeat protein